MFLKIIHNLTMRYYGQLRQTSHLHQSLGYHSRIISKSHALLLLLLHFNYKTESLSKIGKKTQGFKIKKQN